MKLLSLLGLIGLAHADSNMLDLPVETKCIHVDEVSLPVIQEDEEGLDGGNFEEDMPEDYDESYMYYNDPVNLDFSDMDSPSDFTGFGRALRKIKTYRKVTTTTTTTTKKKKTYRKAKKPAYVYRPTTYKTYKPPTNTIYINLNAYTPSTYTPPIYIAPRSSYYQASVVTKLNLNQMCSSNVGCQTSCCKYDNFYNFKACQKSSNCAGSVYVRVSGGGGAGAGAGAGGGAFCFIICCCIWCCKRCKSGGE